METPVTRAQWTALLGTDPSYFKRDPRLPVERINWFEAVALACPRRKACGLLQALVSSVDDSAQTLEWLNTDQSIALSREKSK